MNLPEQLSSKLNLPAMSQVGFVVRDLERYTAYFEQTVGVGRFSRSDRDFTLIFDKIIYRGEIIETDFLMAFSTLGDLELEIIQPIRGKNIYTEFLESGREGLHHLCFDVDDLNGPRPAPPPKSGFRHPRNQGSVLFPSRDFH